MFYIGIDIGSTSTKVAVYDDLQSKFCDLFFIPTGFSGVLAAKQVKDTIYEKKYTPFVVVATGYGRVSVDYANFTKSEILCHGIGGNYLFKKDCTIIDVGGQDTKAIKIEDSKPSDFIMNDKCSAGTGKFLEVTSNRLGLELSQLYSSAKANNSIQINSMCTVFAESEIVSLIAKGVDKSQIAYAIIDSSARKVSTLVKKLENDIYFLSGGLSKVEIFHKLLEKYLGKKVFSDKNAIYCGAIGASLMARQKDIK